MRIAIFAIFLLTTAFGFLLKYLTYSHRNAPLPENVRDVYDEETYKKNQEYKMETLRYSIVTGFVGAVLTLLILGFNFHHFLYGLITARTSNLYLVSLFIIFLPALILALADRILDIYSTFGIEAKFGFNKTTPATFVFDSLKMLVLMLILLGGLLSLFLLLYTLMGDWVFLAFFFVLVAFMLFISFIFPLLIRIFYKLTPLPEGELRDKIQAFADKTGYRLKGIYSVDASKHSTKMNAFASGFGKTKTIGLFDTLIEKMTHDEIIGVLAHEIAHAKKRHVLKSLPLRLASYVVLLAIGFFVVTNPQASQAFGFYDTNLAFGLYILFIVAAPLMTVMMIPQMAQSRKYEYEADKFEVEHVGAATAISSMKKLYLDSLGDLTPHPFVVLVEDSHPPASQRIAAMEMAERNFQKKG